MDWLVFIFVIFIEITSDMVAVDEISQAQFILPFLLTVEKFFFSISELLLSEHWTVSVSACVVFTIVYVYTT